MTAPEYWDKAKKHLSKNDKILGHIIKQYQGEMLLRRGDAFYTLARSIIGQQISVKAADSVWQKFESALKKVTPKNTLKASEEVLRVCGLSGQKVRYLYCLAEHFIEHETQIKNWDTHSDEEILAELTSIKGIGRWTAEMFMIFHLARPDILPLADIGLQKAIFKYYNNGEKMPLSEISKLSEPWQPYRTVATWYFWRALDPVPVAY
jgi:DNA-3-methyladenine glycosylase II